MFSMPVVVRDSGMMWNKDDKLEDVKCVIPDRCYARMYKTVMDDCRENGQFDVSTMGKVILNVCIFTTITLKTPGLIYQNVYHNSFTLL